MTQQFHSWVFIWKKKKKEALIQKDTCTLIFISALFIIAKIWKEPKCPSTDEYIYTHIHWVGQKAHLGFSVMENLNELFGQPNIYHIFFIYIYIFCVCVYIYIYIYIYNTMEYYLAIKKNKILPFATTWIDLEGIMLNEISETQKDKYCMTGVHNHR